MTDSMEKVLEYLGEKKVLVTPPKKKVAKGVQVKVSGAKSARSVAKAARAGAKSARAGIRTVLRGEHAAPAGNKYVKRDAAGGFVLYAPQIRNEVVDVLAKRLSVPAEKVLHISAIAPRTYHRRQQNAEALTPTESDRVLRIARIAKEAERVFGDPAKSSRWLSAENRILGAKPLDMLITDAGTQDVEEELGRIEYGIFS